MVYGAFARPRRLRLLATPIRRALFQASLGQAEEYMAAAEQAGYATRALHLFYALLQAGFAIVAASPAIQQLSSGRGHGIKVIRGATALASIEIMSTGGGDFGAVAAAIGQPPLIQGESIAVGSLWPAIGETRAVPLMPAPPHPLLVFTPDNPSNGQVAHGWLGHVPNEVYRAVGQDQDKLLMHLTAYPSLRGLECTAPQGLAWRPGGAGASWGVHMRMNYQVAGQDVPLIAASAASAGVSDVAYLASPRFGSMTEQLHPILTWWSLLIALSSMTRYDAVEWARMINIDNSVEANAIEHLLDEARIVIPHILLHQLELFA